MIARGSLCPWFTDYQPDARASEGPLQKMGNVISVCLCASQETFVIFFSHWYPRDCCPKDYFFTGAYTEVPESTEPQDEKDSTPIHIEELEHVAIRDIDANVSRLKLAQLPIPARLARSPIQVPHKVPVHLAPHAGNVRCLKPA